MKARTHFFAILQILLFITFVFANQVDTYAADGTKNGNAPELGRYVLSSHNLTTVAIVYDNERRFGISLDTSDDEQSLWSTDLLCAYRDNIILCGSVENINELPNLPENQILALSFDNQSLKVLNQLPEMHGKKNIKNAVLKLEDREKDCPNKTIPGGTISGKLKGISSTVDEFDNEVPIFEMLLESGNEEIVVVDVEDANAKYGNLVGKNISINYDSVNNWSPIAGTCIRYKKFNRMNTAQPAQTEEDDPFAELRPGCLKLAQQLKGDGSFPQIDESSVRGMATWRASICEVDEFPDKSPGTVENLCDARTNSGSVLFWQKRNGKSLKSGFVMCRH